VRILEGTRVVDAPASWRAGLDGRRVVVDLGAGDGRWAYETARNDPAGLYIAIDPDAGALAEYAFKAARKPARGGVVNARFVVASAEQLPRDLTGVADLVRVNFPWGSLLRGLIEPRAAALRGVASLLRPQGRFELVLAYLPDHDRGAFAGGPLPALDESRLQQLATYYRAAGLEIEATRRLARDEALAVPSTWGRRLLHARPRPVFLVSGWAGRSTHEEDVAVSKA
jgi:16S rRNA (adenine(1408)-N(1))-methyltransferase